MSFPILPESAPFSTAQKAWLNGFLAGAFNIDPGGGVGLLAPLSAAPINHAVAAPGISAGQSAPTTSEEEDFPWHDPALPLNDRLKLAEGRPRERVLMAAMAQLDCGACGYLCKSYSEAIASGEETSLTKCTPGGRETSRALKELAGQLKPAPANGKAASSVPAPGNGHTPSSNGTTNGYNRKHPFHSPLLRCDPLNRAGSSKDVRLVALSLQGSSLRYEVGDAIGVFPENDPILVEAVLAALGARGDEWVQGPNGEHAHAFEALSALYSITRVNDDLATLLANHATNPSEASTLRTLVEDDPDGIPADWDLLDLLDQFPSARAPLAEMISALDPLQPRLYSISSSQKAHPHEVHLTVGVVRYERGGRERLGVASGFLGRTMRARQKAKVFIHSSPGFRLPADPSAPLIMIGPGTGIAPFRAFLQDRQATGASGRNWLFFGDQRQDCDFLYRDELEAYQTSGLLTRLDLAFSRDQAEKVYVQHRMLQAAAEFWAWLQDGAHVYVCGDARRMALDVDHALVEIVAGQGGMSLESAREFVKELARAGRYRRDVY